MGVFLSLQMARYLPVQHRPTHRKLWIMKAGMYFSWNIRFLVLSFGNQPLFSPTALSWAFVSSCQVLDNLVVVGDFEVMQMCK